MEIEQRREMAKRAMSAWKRRYEKAGVLCKHKECGWLYDGECCCPNVRKR